jgi:hypothetical protein
VAFRFDRESLTPLWRLPLQQFAYRQLMYLVMIQSATTAMTGGRLRWHKLHRAGLVPRTNELEPVGKVAPAVDTWPSTRSRGEPEHPAAGRAVAPPVPAQPSAGIGPEDLPVAGVKPEDLPSAGSPPAGGSGPVYTG